ncbi:MAG: hypothetical protein R2867_36800 [Caldilineaceae bacterium]
MAAASIHEMSPAQIRQELLRLLSQHKRATVTGAPDRRSIGRPQ